MVSNWVPISIVAVILSQVVPTCEESEDGNKQIAEMQAQINEQLQRSIRQNAAGGIAGKPRPQEKMLREGKDKSRKLTPIVRSRQPHTKERMLRTTPSVKADFDTNKSHSKKAPLGSLRQEKGLKDLEKPRDEFYRRASIDTSEDFPELLCQDMITPYFKGGKCLKDMEKPRRLTLADHAVSRIFHLLKTDSKNYTQEERREFMTEFSNIPIRLYQWDILAIEKLFQTITQKVSTSYWSLKQGLSKFFSNWNMEIASAAPHLPIVLSETKIIRPPCVEVNSIILPTFKTTPPTYPTKNKYRATESDNESDADSDTDSD